MEDQVINELKNIHGGHDWQCAYCGTKSLTIFNAITEIERLRVINIELKAEVLRLQGISNNG